MQAIEESAKLGSLRDYRTRISTKGVSKSYGTALVKPPHRHSDNLRYRLVDEPYSTGLPR